MNTHKHTHSHNLIGYNPEVCTVRTILCASWVKSSLVVLEPGLEVNLAVLLLSAVYGSADPNFHLCFVIGTA